MSEVKARLMGAITVMDEESARRLWSMIERMYSAPDWDSIEEEAPDEADFEMIRQIREDPDCAVLASNEEVQALLG